MSAKTAATLGLVLLGAGCGGAPPLKNVGVAALAAPTPLPTSALSAPKAPSPLGVESHPLAGVPDGSIGPFLARRGDVVMGAYVGASADGARRVVSVPLFANGDTRGDARVIAPVASDAPMLVVRASGGSKPGFIAAWTTLNDRGEALAVVGIADDGRARGDAVEIARTPDDIVWVDVVPTSRGAVALWVEQPRGGTASLLAAALGSDGAMRGVPSRVARGVSGWQVVSSGDGVGLGLVAAPERADRGEKGSKPDRRENGPSTVLWQRLDLDARVLGPPTVVASSVRMVGDVDAVRAGDETLLAWTDGSSPDPQPMLASIDATGTVHGPKRAIEGGFGGTLVGLAAGPAGAVVAWEEPFRRGRASKRITFARVDLAAPSIDPASKAPFDLQGRAVPEIAGMADGFAFLAPARVCAASAACEEAPVPTFVRLDAKLAVTQVEPLRLGALRDHASAAWGLACDSGAHGACVVLAATTSPEDSSTHVSAVHLPVRTTPYRAPVAPPPPRGAPVVDALDTIATGQPFADLASAPLGDGSIVAVLASANDETAKHDDDATIAVHVFDASGAEGAVAPPVTKRALAVGGVAIATTDRPEDGAAVAWVGRDAHDPQVHVARIDRRGKLLHDVQLTNAKGDATDVSIVWSGDKWIVAWVDTRDGNGEVYATTLDRDGRNVGRGQRITHAPGDASDVTMLALPAAAGPDGRGQVWIAWADPRESPQEGFADIYSAELHPRDASRVGDEVRVLATAAHSRSPALGAIGKDVAVGWIEEAPMGADPNHTRAYGAMLAWLAPGGVPASEPARLPVGGDGFPTAITLEGEQNTLRVVLARAASDLIVLEGLDLTRAGSDPGAPFPFVTLDGPPSLDVALAMTGDALFFNDESADADSRRVRRATIRWGR